MLRIAVIGAGIAGLSCASALAVAVGYDERLDTGFDAAFARGQPVNWLARNGSKPGRAGTPDVWVLHAAPAWLHAHRL